MSPALPTRILVCGLLLGCAAPSPSVPDVSQVQEPAAPVVDSRPVTSTRVSFGVGGEVVEADVVWTESGRSRGLMYREVLSAGQGMLFVFPEREIQSFWMKNTLISLDMIFIEAVDGEWRVGGVLHQAEPRTLSPRSAGGPCRLVLEVPGGWAATHQIQKGTTVSVHQVDTLLRQAK